MVILIVSLGKTKELTLLRSLVSWGIQLSWLYIFPP